MNGFKGRQIVYLAVWTALTVGLGIIVKLQTPVGIFTPMCDVGIFLGARFFGSVGGLAVGAGSGLFIDLLSGAPEWMLFSLLIHGLQGFVVGKLLACKKSEQTFSWSLFSFIAGGLVMIVGYAFAGAFLYGWGVSIVQVPSNIMQTGIGIAIALLVEAVVGKSLQRFLDS